MKVIYVAGPFIGKNAWEIENNIRRAEEAGLMVAQLGAMPLIPHANTRFFHGTLPEQFFLEGTLELLKRCDAIVVCNGWESSQGTLRELEYARQANMPIFFVHLIDSRIKFKEWLTKD